MELAAKHATIVYHFALLIRCLPFVDSHCPNLCCVFLEKTTDVGNDLLLTGMKPNYYLPIFLN